MAAYLSPIGNEPQVDANGNPLSGGKIYTYLSGTTTPAPTYTSSTGLVQQANPIILNSRGCPANPVWLGAGVAMKLIITDLNDVAQAPSFDGITGINDPAAASVVDQWVTFTGTATYISATSFSVSGDQTGILQVGRRVKTVNSGGTIYSTIVTSVFSTVTTITLLNDSGTLDSGLSAVSYGLLSPLSNSVPTNFVPFGVTKTLTSSVAASAMTIGLSAGLIDFRSATVGSGTVNTRSFSAVSLTIPSTATMGQSNNAAARLWVAAIDNAGTVELAVCNTQLGSGQLFAVSESSLISTTALSAASSSAGVWYSTSARASVPFRLVGYIENAQVTAGTWATAASVIQGMGAGVHKPGDVVQIVQTVTGGGNTGSTILPADDTIPQSGEGDQYMSQAITPTSGINALEIEAVAFLASNAAIGTGVTAALFQDANANAVAASLKTSPGVSYMNDFRIFYAARSGTVSATTFKVRGGASVAGTTTFNGTGGGRQMGGVLASYIKALERMA